MKRFNKCILVTLSSLFLVSCSNLVDLTQKNKNNLNDIQTIPEIKGNVNFSNLNFNIKATKSDITNNGATVSLIFPEQSKTVAVGLTDSNGEFVLLSNYKVPISPTQILNKILILEAHKRFPDPSKGRMIALRSLIKLRSDFKFESITGLTHFVNNATTGISTLAAKNKFTNLDNVLSKVNSTDPNNIIISPIETYTVDQIQNEIGLVESKLTENIDPIFDLSKSTSLEGGIGGEN